MKAKLINRWGDYRLYVNETPYATTGDSPYKKLSLKNCQAIERGYNLDELAREMTDKEHQLVTQYSKGYEKGIVIGFQKALELMGDKKFSEEDMKSFAQNYYREIRENTSNLLWNQLADKCLEEHIQSLQQTEWDVEIEMESNLHIGEVADDSYPKGFPTQKPKLDTDGYLILKRI
jgi:hypothetical protein